MCGSGSCRTGIALGVLSVGNSVPCTSSRVVPVSGSRVGSVVIIESEAVDDEEGEGFGIGVSFRKNFLFLNVTLPVPSTFTAY